MSPRLPIGVQVRKTRPSRVQPGKISVMLVDDHPLWRDTVKQVLEGSGVGRVVAEASDGTEAVSMAARVRPQVVLMDMLLPTMNGVDATRGLLTIHPGAKVLVLSSSQERSDVLRAVKAGASGYLLKSAAAEEIATAVRRVHEGEIVLPPSLAGMVLEEFRSTPEPAIASTLRVALASQSVLDREGLNRVLSEAGFEVTGSEHDRSDLLATMLEDAPDVAIVVVHGNEGLDVAHEIRAAHPDVGVLILSDTVDASSAMSLLSDGSEGIGYLLRDRVSDLDELVDAIRRVARGESVVDPLIIGGLVGGRTQRSPLNDLTKRERAVLELMAEGRSNQAISERLFLSSKTVEKYVRSMFAKLGLTETPDDHRRVLAVIAYLRST